MPRTVLFLCTGNYFRSRLAEHLFDHLAAAAGIDWRASSRALAPLPELRNPGPISAVTLAALRARGVSLAGPDRGPLDCRAIDLASAELVVALNEPEHAPLLAARFPTHAARVEHWHCPDLAVGDEATAGEPSAVCRVEEQVTALVRRLAAGRVPLDNGTL